MRNIEGTRKQSLLSILKLSARCAPLFFTLCLVLTILDGFLAPMMLVVAANFIDTAMTLATPSPKYSEMVLYTVLLMLGYLYTQLSQDWKNYGYHMMQDRFRLTLAPKMIKKQFSIDYAVYEDTQTQDLILRVMDQIDQKFTNIVRTCNDSMTIFIQIIGVLATIAAYHPVLIMVYLCTIVPLFFLTLRNGKVIYTEEKKINQVTRKMKYLSEILSNREAAGERTLFGYASSINKRFQQAHLYRSNYNTRVLAKETASATLVHVAVNAVSLLILYLLSYQVEDGRITVGLFTAITGNLINLNKVISLQFSELILQFSFHHEYAKDFDAFYKLKKNQDVFSRPDEKIEFESLEIINLSFRYLASQPYILKGLNLTLERGKSYSMVGINGAGKTTLTKILLGLYRSYEGEIRLNGRDLRAYSLSQLRQLFSVVSQDYAKYYVSFKENIVLDDSDTDISGFLNEIKLSGLAQSLPEQMDTKLGKIDKNGTDLSGGQWQRIAIARALYRDTSFIILDEPTSSLSPTAESEIYHQFMETARNKTLFMISHRLGSTKIADKIIVLDQGKVAEQGSHEALIKDNKLYAQLFRTQSEMYYAENKKEL